MEKKGQISVGEFIKAALSALLIAAVIGGVLFVADCNQCIYTGSERYSSPDGRHVITVHYSSPHPHTMDTYKIRVTASNDGWLTGTVKVIEKYSGVLSWSVEWVDNETALVALDSAFRDSTVTIDFSNGAPVFSE